MAIREFAISLIGIFIPIYLYVERGFSFVDTLSFFIFYSVTFAIITPLAAKFSARFGVKHSILLSIPLYLTSIGLLYGLNHFNISLIIISSLLGASQAFYWMGMHLEFLRASDKKHRGEEVGKRIGFALITGMTAPFFGGLLISLFGFGLVFSFTTVMLISSALILFRSKDKHTSYNFSLRSVINKDHWKDSLFFVSEGTQVMAEGVIWPLFIFFILGSYLSLGLIGSLLSGISAILVVVFGKFSDHTNKRKIIRWSSVMDSLAWVMRAFVMTVSQVYAATIIAAMAKGIKDSPVGALEYDKAKGEATAYFVSREIFICLGRILMLMFVLMTNSLSGGLLFQSLANLAALLF